MAGDARGSVADEGARMEERMEMDPTNKMRICDDDIDRTGAKDARAIRRGFGFAYITLVRV